MGKHFSNEEITEMRTLYESGEYTKKDLSKIYSCSQTTIALWLPKVSEYRDKKLHNNRFSKACCVKCKESFTTHKRCELCTILLHDKPCDCNA